MALKRSLLGKWIDSVKMIILLNPQVAIASRQFFVSLSIDSLIVMEEMSLWIWSLATSSVSQTKNEEMLDVHLWFK